ncbi:MAG: hypothetical protein M1825_000988 [Sarcosagium campestre]|nr:MAG: hypothetical protein M1825_000988 [Sarcosagium campestre]
MRPTFLVLCALVLPLSAFSPVDRNARDIVRRQEGRPPPANPAPPAASAPASNTAASDNAAATGTGEAEASKESTPASASEPESAPASASASGSAAKSDSPASTTATASETAAMTQESASVPSDKDAPEAIPSDVAVTTDPNVLPLKPSITPGLSVAGVIMLLSGIGYTLVGIKERRVHIALSMAYLTSLAVTVLIVYVMNPPISNAIQGAYVVAAVLTGVIFGALSLVFTEVTEGLGCLLGGFCVSMWLLVLKPGGLLTSVAGKAALISAFTAAAYALSFSRYTRNYGLIVSTSFAGATVVILGIDCFSQAGLKEFWIYIWALNDKIFPLNTNTYPHTRGIRVEIAGVILIFLLGIVSQLKLWKMIKERREKKELDRLQDEQDLDKIETDVGRRVEATNDRERADWEAVYGNGEYKSREKADSGLGDELASTRKSSTSNSDAREQPNQSHDVIELDDMEQAHETGHPGPLVTGARDRPSVMVHVAEDEETRREIGVERKPSTSADPAKSARSSVRDFGATFTLPSPSYDTSRGVDAQAGTMPKRNSARSSVPPAPEVVPLPFKVPTAEDANTEDGRSSVATFAESDHAVVRRKSKRASAASALNRLSRGSRGTPRHSLAMSESSEALVVPHEEDDRASSVAATVDDLTDDQESLPSQSRGTPVPFGEDVEPSNGHPGQTIRRVSSQSSIADVEPETPKDGVQRYSLNRDGDVASVPRIMGENQGGDSDATTPIGAETDGFAVPPSSGSPQRKISTGSKMKASKSLKSVRSGAASEVLGRHSVTSLNGQLPEHLSKVVMSYRTNEWAKHLDAAEKPALDEIKLPAYPSLQTSKKTEEPAPLDVEQLQQTADNAQLPPLPRSVSQASVQAPPQPLLNRSVSNLSRMSLHEGQAGNLSRAASSGSMYQQSQLQRSTSQLSFKGSSPTASRLHGSTSMPLHPLATAQRGIRSISTPALSEALTESATEESTPERSAAWRTTPSPMPTSTLIGQRDSMMRNKYSSLSMYNLASLPESRMEQQITPNDSASVYSASRASLALGGSGDDDDMPLAERKDLIQRQHQLQRPMSASQTQIFNSHQPARIPTVPDAQKREHMLATWRASIQEDLTLNQLPKAATDARRAEMLAERQQKQQSQRQQAVVSTLRESQIDERMRRGDLHDLHKEAMRRMQANANKHVS